MVLLREKKPYFFTLERACTRSTRTAEREFKNDHTHNTISTASLCFSPPKTREKTLSLSLSLEKRRRIFSVSWLLALSRELFPVHFLPLQKSCITRARSFALSLTHARKEQLRVKSMRRWYTTAFLFAHSSERVVVRAKKEEERHSF